MNLDIDYLDRVRRLALLFTKRKTSDLLEGDFSSRQHGRSLDFDDLREYRYGDEISDIDWKSSSRTGRTLVRRYFADRRHDVLFVCDTGAKMGGDTPDGGSKRHLALMTFGVCAALFDKQGVNYAIAYSAAQGDHTSKFLSGTAHLERLLALYQRALEDEAPGRTLNDVLERVCAAYSRHMILVVITDGEGLAGIDEALIRRMIHRNDVYLFKLEDAFLTSPDAFDLQANRFEDPFVALDARLHREEEQLRSALEAQAERLMTPYRVFFRSIAGEEEIFDALAALLRRRREV